MLPPPLPPGPPPHPLVPQLRGRGGLQLHPVQVVPGGEVQLVRMGASRPRPPPPGSSSRVPHVTRRGALCLSRACTTEHAACSSVPSHASPGPKKTRRF